MLKFYYGNIDVFDVEPLFSEGLKKVDEKRREKVLRCKNVEDKKRSLLAGLLLRLALEEAGYYYDQIVFATTSNGKPYIELDEDIHFSISHSGDYVGCVLSDSPVGLDIEFSKKAIFSPEKEESLWRMSKKCLSEGEWQLFSSSVEREKLFLSYWTKKEAYSKCLGKGIGMDFSNIDTESMKDKFWSQWTEDGYHMSMYRMSESYEELIMKKIGSKEL